MLCVMSVYRVDSGVRIELDTCAVVVSVEEQPVRRTKHLVRHQLHPLPATETRRRHHSSCLPDIISIIIITTTIIIKTCYGAPQPMLRSASKHKLTRIWHVPAKHANRMDARAHSWSLAECAPRFMTRTVLSSCE